MLLAVPRDKWGSTGHSGGWRGEGEEPTGKAEETGFRMANLNNISGLGSAGAVLSCLVPDSGVILAPSVRAPREPDKAGGWGVSLHWLV